MLWPTKEKAESHYADLATKPFFKVRRRFLVSARVKKASFVSFTRHGHPPAVALTPCLSALRSLPTGARCLLLLRPHRGHGLGGQGRHQDRPRPPRGHQPRRRRPGDHPRGPGHQRGPQHLSRLGRSRVGRARNRELVHARGGFGLPAQPGRMDRVRQLGGAERDEGALARTPCLVGRSVARPVRMQYPGARSGTYREEDRVAARWRDPLEWKRWDKNGDDSLCVSRPLPAGLCQTCISFKPEKMQ